MSVRQSFLQKPNHLHHHHLYHQKLTKVPRYLVFLGTIVQLITPEITLPSLSINTKTKLNTNTYNTTLDVE